MLLNIGKGPLATQAGKVLLACSYIKGPKVDAWVAGQVEALENRIAAGGGPNDLVHWAEFRSNFRRAWAGVNIQEHAALALEELTMTGKNLSLEDYISEFELLIAQAGWQRDDIGTC